MNPHLVSLSLKAVMDTLIDLAIMCQGFSTLSHTHLFARGDNPQTHAKSEASVVCSLANLSAITYFCNSCNVTSAGRSGRHLRTGT